MRLKSVLAHAILAVGGLVLAYLVWTDDAPQMREGEVAIFACDPASVTALELRSDSEDVTVSLTREGEALRSQITVVERPDEGEPRTRRFTGSHEVASYLEKMAPLVARRSLGELDAAQLEAVGLGDPSTRLTLRCGSRERTFEVGGRALGQGDRYLRSTEGGAVYLVERDRIGPLESADVRLMQRELHRIEWPEVVSLTVRGFDRQERLVHRNRHDLRRASWVDPEHADRRNERYASFVSRYQRLRAQRYLDRDALPDGAERLMRLTIDGEDGELGNAELARGPDGAKWYARTEATAWWVEVPVSVAQGVERDLRAVLGVEAETETETETTEAESETETESGLGTVP